MAGKTPAAVAENGMDGQGSQQTEPPMPQRPMGAQPPDMPAQGVAQQLPTSGAAAAPAAAAAESDRRRSSEAQEAESELGLDEEGPAGAEDEEAAVQRKEWQAEAAGGSAR